jgi:hypothetical protein
MLQLKNILLFFFAFLVLDFSTPLNFTKFDCSTESTLSTGKKLVCTGTVPVPLDEKIRHTGMGGLFRYRYYCRRELLTAAVLKIVSNYLLKATIFKYLLSMLKLEKHKLSTGPVPVNDLPYR